MSFIGGESASQICFDVSWQSVLTRSMMLLKYLYIQSKLCNALERVNGELLAIKLGIHALALENHLLASLYASSRSLTQESPR